MYRMNSAVFWIGFTNIQEYIFLVNFEKVFWYDYIYGNQKYQEIKF